MMDRTIYYGDNLMLLKEFHNDVVDLVYMDPPFAAQRNFGAFDDRWGAMDADALDGMPRDAAAFIEAAARVHSPGMGSYLAFLCARLVELKRVMKPTASIWLHCDDSAVGYIRGLMDAVFGKSAYSAQVAWKRTTAHSCATKNLGRVTDYILLYRGPGAVWNAPRVSHDPAYIRKSFRHDDGDGRGRYTLADMSSPRPSPNLLYDYKGRAHPKNGWRVVREKMEKMDAEGRLHFPPSGKNVRRKFYLYEMKKKIVGNLWDDIVFGAGSGERTGYPTQKPLALLERIIRASSDPWDFVLDPFMGSGTTLEASERLGRRWAGMDAGREAVDAALNRLRAAGVPVRLHGRGQPPPPGGRSQGRT